MAEAFDYRSEAVQNSAGETVDYARFRRRRGESWDNAEFRGTGATANGGVQGPGAVRRAVRGAAGRGAARNPAMRTQIRNFRAANTTSQTRRSNR